MITANDNIMDMNDIETIAVIGLACRFPGANNKDQFWENLRNGVDSIIRFTDDELLAHGIPPEVINDPNYVKVGTVLKGFKDFDAHFFGYTPKEASLIDPQQRIFLETAWEALEDAGYNPKNFDGHIGVFAGATPNGYADRLNYGIKRNNVAHAFQVLIGNERDFLSTRVSHKLDLKGTSLTIQSACSSSLVAVAMACQSLLSYQCSMILAGGVSINLEQNYGYYYQEGTIVSPDGYCRAFDAEANGTVLGQGVGVVVLKRLSDAVKDGDTIYAVIKGSATNNDGGQKAGYTAPSIEGQAEVIRMAIELSGIDAESIGYIETHGTGTLLGDPVEMAALTQAFRNYTSKNGFCKIGSVKTNIGHADAAAGIAGLIKTVLSLEHKQIPPSLHFRQPNPKIDFNNSPFQVNSKLQKWESNGIPRRAGVSAFGIGGTNAHVILEEAPESKLTGDSRPYQLLVFSAMTESALEKTTDNFVEHMKKNPKINCADSAYTLQTGRKAFNHRRIAVCRNIDTAISVLEKKDPGHVWSTNQEKRNPSVVFMFTGQGSQYVNMGLDLYRTESEFRLNIDRCSDILQQYLNRDIRGIIYPQNGDIKDAERELKETVITQPALFIIEYALSKLWISWGIHPQALIGHSIGEYVAAVLAGVFTLEDALSIVVKRSQLMQDLPRGAMLAVPISNESIIPLLNDNISIAATNAPSYCVVSGENEAINLFKNKLAKQGINSRELHTSHAFHSKMMEPILNEFTKAVSKVNLNSPEIPFISNVSGSWITSEQATDPNYWSKHIRNTVRFSEGIEELLKEKNRILLELGPGQTLGTLVRMNSNLTDDHTVLSSLSHPKEQVSDIAFIFQTIGKLWLAGIDFDWQKLYPEENRRKLPLPTYPFERKRCWIDIESTVDTLSDSDTQKSDKSETTKEQYHKKSHDEIIQLITDIWKECLGIDHLTIHDNFFNLGGHSLMAVQIVQEINTKFNIKIPISELIDNPVINDFIQVISRELTEEKYRVDESTITPRGPHDALVLSAAQKRLWFLNLYDPDNPAYNLALSLRITGSIDLGILQESTAILLQRHEAFKTTFFNIDGKPLIKIDSEAILNIETIDLISYNPIQGQGKLRQSVIKNVSQPFHLDKLPLYKIIFYRITADEVVLVLFIPHILIDGWSFNIFHQELATVYSDLAAGKQPELPELTVQYADYAIWEQTQQAALNRKSDIDYWQKYLGSDIPILEFPYEESRPGKLSAQGATCHFSLSREVSRSIKQFCEKHTVTPFICLLSALHVLFHKYTSQDKIIIGTPYANRENREVKNIIGFFLNMLANKADFSQDLTFLQLVNMIKEGFYNSLEHGQLHFEELLNVLKVERHINIHPLFQVMFAFQSYLTAEIQTGNITFAEEIPERGLSEYDFSFYIWEKEDQFHGCIEYSTDLSHEPMVKRLLVHFEEVLRHVTENGDNSISQLSLLTQAERHKILNTWNDTQQHLNKETYFIEMFNEKSRTYKNKTAVICDKESISYKNLNALSNRMAHYLIKKGLTPNTSVGVCLERNIQMLVTILGILKAGANYVPLDPSFPKQRLNFMIDDSQLKFIISTSDLTSYFDYTPPVVLLFLEKHWDAMLREPDINGSTQINGDTTAYIIYTSGSTGKPKGVQIHHAALTNFLLAMQQLPGIKQCDRLLALTTLSFDISCLELYLPLITGATIVLATSQISRDGQQLMRYIAQNHVSMIQATPATFQMLYQLDWHPPKKIKILCGGEALPLELANKLQEQAGSVWNVYGPTETTVWSSIYKLNGHNDKPLIGKPIRNTTFYVLDKHLKPVPVGVIGELFIGGQGVSRGYLNRPELTSERFIVNPITGNKQEKVYRTGDLVKYLDDGNLEYISRVDFQIKLRGFRVELGEIESILDAYPGIIQSICTIYKFSENDKRLVAYLKTKENLDISAIKEYLSNHLPEYMIPNIIQCVDEFPLTPNNKVDRKALPKPDIKTTGAVEESLSHTPSERKLLKIWENLLKVEKIGINDNFFNLGGHSLLAAQLFSDIEKAFGKNIPLSMLFKAPTVKTLSKIIDHEPTQNLWSCLVPIQAMGSKRPLFLIHGAEGNVLMFKSLADRLGNDQPVFGIQAEALDGRTEIQADFKTVAGRYIQEIKKVQPQGPYLLGGYCLGGNIALEVAQQLQLKGDTIGCVALIESYNEKSVKRPIPFKTRKTNELLNVLYHIKNFFAAGNGSKMDFLKQKYRIQLSRIKFSMKFNLIRGLQLFGVNSQNGLYHLRIKKYFDQALLEYEPSEYNGRIDLFIPKALFIGYEDPECGFGHIAKQGVVKHLIPCYPRGTLIEPFVKNLANEIQKAINGSTSN